MMSGNTSMDSAMNDSTYIYEKPVYINAFECDVNLRWKPAAFFQHLTEAAGEHATRLGCGFETMYARNLLWVHSRMKIKFLRFPKVAEVVTITTWPKTIQQKLFFVRDYLIHSSDGEQLAAATSAWLIIDATARRMVPPRTAGLDLPAVPERIALDEPLERLSVPENGEECLSLRAGYSAVDMLGHVNNSRYVEWICDSFPMEMHRANSMEWMQINYDKEVLSGENVNISLLNAPEKPAFWSVMGTNLSNDTRAFEAVVKWND